VPNIYSINNENTSEQCVMVFEVIWLGFGLITSERNKKKNKNEIAGPMKIGKTFIHIQADMLQENKHRVSFLKNMLQNSKMWGNQYLHIQLHKCTIFK